MKIGDKFPCGEIIEVSQICVSSHQLKDRRAVEKQIVWSELGSTSTEGRCHEAFGIRA